MKNRRAFILNPTQSRRLIAKGVCNLPQIREALESKKIFIGGGSTNAFVLEEIFKLKNIEEHFNKGDYTAGQIIPGNTFMKWGINQGNRKKEVLLKKGVPKEYEDRTKVFQRFHQGDIYIKGANALDINGIPAVLVGGENGGSIGTLQGILQAKGIEIICPIGLEKMIYGDVNSLMEVMGTENMDPPSEGISCGLIPIPGATVITEIEALEILFDCEVYHVASGGVGGAEGSVSLLVDAFDDEEMRKINEFMEKISLEPIYQPNL
ncbi:MAG: hypothetical protein ACTSWX_08615 [Promethearchaeota archaeon]